MFCDSPSFRVVKDNIKFSEGNLTRNSPRNQKRLFNDLFIDQPDALKTTPRKLGHYIP